MTQKQSPQHRSFESELDRCGMAFRIACIIPWSKEPRHMDPNEYVTLRYNEEATAGEQHPEAALVS